MKKSLAAVAVLAMAIAISGCKKEPAVEVEKPADIEKPAEVEKPKEDDEPAKASEVKASSLEKSGAEKSFESQEQLFEVIQSMDSSSLMALANQVSGAFSDIFGFSVESERNITSEQLSTELADITTQFKDFYAKVEQGKSASIAIDKSFGEITDFKEKGAIAVSIPTTVINADVLVSEKTGEVNASGNVKSVVDVAIDCTKFDEESMVKSLVLGMAVNGSGKMSMKIVDEQPEYQGNLNVSLTANVGASVCIPYEDSTIGGKIIAKGTIGLNIEDLSKIDVDFAGISEEVNFEEINFEEIIGKLGDYIPVSISISVYDDSNNFVCDLITIESLEDLMELVPQGETDEDESENEYPDFDLDF